MKAPTRRISQNEPDSHQRSVSWCVAFVRYQTVVAAETDAGTYNDTKPIMIVENDCLSVNLSSPKSGFSKTCNLTMRPGEVYYQNAVNPGDWVFVWINDHQTDIDGIVSVLKNVASSRKPDPRLNNWFSGLKFFGRVLSVSSTDSVDASGPRNVSQTISAQSFLELASSVYYTEVARFFLMNSVVSSRPLASDTASNNVIGSGINGMDKALSGLGSKIIQFFDGNDNVAKQYPTPDRAVPIMFALTLGVDREDSIGPFRGTYSDSIDVPADVAAIMGKPRAKKLWQLYNVYSGLQKYGNKDATKPWVDFSPDVQAQLVTDTGPVFLKTGIPCKGKIPFRAVPWTNRSVWDIMAEYAHLQMNEMYTAFRCDANNQIRPTLMIREKPFSTGLFFNISRKMNPLIQQLRDNRRDTQTGKSNYKTTTTKSVASQTASKVPMDATRAMYYTHPRWIIDDEMIRSINTYTNESNRVNFVQMWGTTLNIDLFRPQNESAQTNPAAEYHQELQLLNGNFASDDLDISRHGLRAVIENTNFDEPEPQTPLWTRIKADWLFNGHLKLNATVVCNGIQEPICEGDNCQIRGIVYHIENVSHRAAISGGGKKEWITTLTLSNGIVEESLTAADQVPQYAAHRGANEGYRREIADMPGVTDYQLTSKPNRDDNGERKD